MHIYNIRNFTRITKFYKSIATNPRELHACAQVGAQARAYDASANAGTQAQLHKGGRMMQARAQAHYRTLRIIRLRFILVKKRFELLKLARIV